MTRPGRKGVPQPEDTSLKRCAMCLEPKPHSEFYPAPNYLYGIGSYCKGCEAKRAKLKVTPDTEEYRRKRVRQTQDYYRRHRREILNKRRAERADKAQYFRLMLSPEMLAYVKSQKRPTRYIQELIQNDMNETGVRAMNANGTYSSREVSGAKRRNVGDSRFNHDANAAIAVRRCRVGEVAVMPDGSEWLRTDARIDGCALVAVSVPDGPFESEDFEIV